MSGGITGLSVRRPIGVGVLAAAICVLGWIAVMRLPIDLLPEVDFPRISIVTNYEGVGPEEIENLLTRPIEQAVSTIDGVTRLNAESAEGLSRVELQFDWGIDLDAAVNDVRSALDRLRARLPEDAEQPTVLKFDISATPIATLGLSGGGDPRRLRYLADALLTRRLERIVAGTLTTIAVFAPVVFLAGFAGVFFAEMAMVVVFSLLCSLVVAITLVPTLAARLLGHRRVPVSRLQRVSDVLERAFKALEQGYGRLLQVTLRNRWLAVAASAVLLLATYRLVSLVQVELMPQTDEGVVDLDFELPVGTPVERTREVVFEMERRIRAVVKPEEIDNVVSSAGPDNPYRPGGGHEGEVEVTLVPVSQRERGSAVIVEAMLQAVRGIPDVKPRIRQRTTNPLQRFMRGSQGERLVVEVRGHELPEAAALGRRIEGIMKDIPGITDVRIGREEGLEERTIDVDTMRAADVGLERAEIARTLETYVLGKVATRLREAGDEYAIRVMLREQDRAETAQLAALPLLTPRGVVPLSAVATIGVRRGPGSIEREGQERVLSIVGGLGDRPLGAVVADLEAALADVERPPGFSIAIAGEAREQASTFAGLQIGIVLAILLVFAVMAVQFESIRHPLIVMSAVPFGFVGVVLALLVTSTTFSLNAFLGSIVLVGIAVNNAIVLIDAANQLRREQGLDAVAAIVEAGRRRLRPILMTTMTTVLAMLPIAFALAEGAEIQAPLARVIVGGLLVSTVVTLVLLPVLYVLTAGRRFHSST
ncbi:MAG: efflux RND transporter permease subunit [Deltaproteobacteria bacterium]|nr:efflux RND transporter permease subunit [Deltaproteobacteria bacterium]